MNLEKEKKNVLRNKNERQNKVISRKHGTLIREWFINVKIKFCPTEKCHYNFEILVERCLMLPSIDLK